MIREADIDGDGQVNYEGECHCQDRRPCCHPAFPLSATGSCWHPVGHRWHPPTGLLIPRCHTAFPITIGLGYYRVPCHNWPGTPQCALSPPARVPHWGQGQEWGWGQHPCLRSPGRWDPTTFLHLQEARPHRVPASQPHSVPCPRHVPHPQGLYSAPCPQCAPCPCSVSALVVSPSPSCPHPYQPFLFPGRVCADDDGKVRGHEATRNHLPPRRLPLPVPATKRSPDLPPAPQTHQSGAPVGLWGKGTPPG